MFSWAPLEEKRFSVVRNKKDQGRNDKDRQQHAKAYQAKDKVE